MSKLLSQGGFGCVFYPGVKCNGKANPSKSIVTKIQVNNYNAQNESNIGEIIETIQNYRLYFLPVISSCPINVRKIDKSVISKCEIIKKGDDYVAMDIDYISTVDFTNVLRKVSSKRLLLLLYQTYSYLLKGLKLLQEKRVIHYDLKLDNLLFVKETNQPRIIDFGISISVDDITEETWNDNFYVYAPEYYVWCIEINMINYLIHHDIDILTKEDMKLVVDMSIFNNPMLKRDTELQEEYKKQSYDFYMQYVGKHSRDIIIKLLSYHETWDNYSLSILFYTLLDKLFEKEDDKNDYIKGIERLALRNIHPDPQRRLTLDETSSKLEDILYEDGSVKSYLTLANHIIKDKKSVSIKINEQSRELNKSAHRKGD